MQRRCVSIQKHEMSATLSSPPGQSVFERLLPRQADNRYQGYRLALWLLGLLIALKLVMSVNSILNTESVAVGADRIPLDSFGPAAAREVLLLFALMALGHLALTLIALTTLIRYRALVPFIYLVLIGEQIARRAIIQAQAVGSAGGGGVGWYVNYGFLTLMALGLLLSLVPARPRELASHSAPDADPAP
jgi:hypothetical protein